MKKFIQLIKGFFVKPDVSGNEALRVALPTTEFHSVQEAPPRKKDKKEFSVPLWLKLPSGEIIKGYGFFGAMKSCTWCDDEGFAPYNIVGWSCRQ